MIKFTLRLSEDEKKLLDIKSSETKKSKNDLMKLLIKNHLLGINDELEIYKNLTNEFKNLAFEIKKIGINLNQINKNFYQNKNVRIEEIEKELENLWQLIKQLKE